MAEVPDELIVDIQKVALIKKTKDRVEKLYSVELGFDIVAEEGKKQWISVKGAKKGRNKAKEYIKALCNPDETMTVPYPQDLHKILTSETIHEKLEHQSKAAIIFTENYEAFIMGSELAVTLALSALEDLMTKYHDGIESGPDLPVSASPYSQNKGSARLDRQLSDLFAKHKEEIDYDQEEDMSTVPDNVKRIFLSWLVEEEDQEEQRKADSEVIDLITPMRPQTAAGHADIGVGETPVVLMDIPAKQGIGRHPGDVATAQLVDLSETSVIEDIDDVQFSRPTKTGKLLELSDDENETDEQKSKNTYMRGNSQTQVKGFVSLGMSKYNFTPMDTTAGTKAAHNGNQSVSDSVIQTDQSQTVPGTSKYKSFVPASKQIVETKENEELEDFPHQYSFALGMGYAKDELRRVVEEHGTKLTVSELIQALYNNRKAKETTQGSMLLDAIVKTGSNSETITRVEESVKPSPSGITENSKSGEGNVTLIRQEMITQNESVARTESPSTALAEQFISMSPDEGITFTEEEREEQRKLLEMFEKKKQQETNKGKNKLGNAAVKQKQEQSPAGKKQKKKKHKPSSPSKSQKISGEVYPEEDKQKEHASRQRVRSGPPLTHRSPSPSRSASRSPIRSNDSTVDGQVQRFDYGHGSNRFDYKHGNVHDYQHGPIGQQYMQHGIVPGMVPVGPPTENRYVQNEAYRAPMPQFPGSRNVPQPMNNLNIPRAPPAPVPVDPKKLRHIVIDGSNVAMAHGNNAEYSSRGIQICIDYFRKRGHKDITAFVPQYRKSPMKSKDSHILVQLSKEGVLVFTPSRKVQGKNLVCYDDRYVVQLAAEVDGVMVSNDNYRDLMEERPEWKPLIEKRLLLYTFAGDIFMPPEDPLGKDGPTLSQFLSKEDFPMPPLNTRLQYQQPYGQRNQQYGGHGNRRPPWQQQQQMPAQGHSGWQRQRGNFAHQQRAPHTFTAIDQLDGQSCSQSHNTSQAQTKKVREGHVTIELIKKLKDVFPDAGPKITAVLQNHPLETDIEKLSSYVLDAM